MWVIPLRRIYRGWALPGIVVFGSLALNLVLTILLRGGRRVFPPALIAFVCMAATQIVFRVFTFPVARLDMAPMKLESFPNTVEDVPFQGCPSGNRG